MSAKSVHAALRTQLNALNPSYPIQWEGTKLDANVRTFLQPQFMPAESVTNTIGSSTFQRLEGVFQVMIYTPAGGGSAAAETIADALLALFPRNATLASGGVTVYIQKSWRDGAMTDGVWYRIPVSIRYWANLAP